MSLHPLSVVPKRASAGEGRLPYFPALDGVRGIAIAMVLAIHMSYGRYPGGLLGVDVFFVLSGFLITTLLLREWRFSGTISLRRFYWHRARRLVPALLVVVATGAVLTATIPETRGSIPYPVAAISVLLYAGNWMIIWDDSSLRLLIHTWSLAIEEQFYILWPALLIVLLRRRPTAKRLLSTIGSIALCCFAFSAIAAVLTNWDLYDNTVPRFAELMIGCMVAVLVDRPVRSAQMILRYLGHLVPAALSLAAVLCAGFVVDGADRWLYYGGLVAFALATASVIAHCVSQRSPLTSGLSWVPLVYLGRISYGVYLYHMPITIAVSPATLPINAATSIAVRLALTLGVAVLSFHYLETPIRRWAGLRGRAAVSMANV